jgi:acyl dehydratase
VSSGRTHESPRRLHLEDLQVGQRFTSATHTMDARAIKEFALQFDPQPFHYDEEAAAKTVFGGLAASGWHTAAVSIRLMVESGLPFAGGLIGAGGTIDWPRATRPGDTLHVVCEVMEIMPSRSRPERGLVTMRCETRNQHGEIVQVFVGRMIVWRRPAGAE